MRRLSLAITTAFLACLLSGCGEGQPNAPAQPSEVNADFAQKSGEMMKAANTGMDKKAAARPRSIPK